MPSCGLYSVRQVRYIYKVNKNGRCIYIKLSYKSFVLKSHCFLYIVKYSVKLKQGLSDLIQAL